MYDVIIIGAGAVGCATARQLSKYQLKIAVLEKGADVCDGTSKANSGIVHGGYDSKAGTLKSELAVKGNALFKELDHELNFGFDKCGSYVLAFDEEDHEELKKLYENGVKSGVKNLSIVDRNFVLRNEPNVNPKVHSALFCGSAGIVSPFEYTVALAENAAENGVEFRLNAEVTDIRESESGYDLFVGDEVLPARYVINSAGLYSDHIARMVGIDDYKLTPRKGEYLLFDKVIGDTVESVLFQTPRGGTKGILATPTIHGNFMLGPNAAFTDDREELKTTAEGLKEVAEIGKKTVPNVDFSKVITQFSGLRASMATYDFVIEESKKGFVNLIGIDSPGLTASPAIALKVEEIVKNSGLDLKEDPNFSSYRTPYIRLENMSNEEINELIAQEPTYGKIVCRCETITEGEIRDVLSRKVPVMTVDGIKRRARATSGRCQGGFCTPKVLDILSDVYGKDPTEITKNGPGANLLTGRTKVATGGGK